MNKKVVTFTIAMVLLLGVTLGATFAYLTAEKKSVTNTFVAGGFGELGLVETIGEDSNITNPSPITVLPGKNVLKQPYISFDYFEDENITAAYIFAKVETGTSWTIDSTDTNKYNAIDGKVSFSIDTDNNWTPVTGNPGVYYKLINDGVNKADLAATSLFAESVEGEDTYTVSVDESITSTQLSDFAEHGEIIITAYAIQQEGFNDAASAWAVVSTLG